MDPMDPSSYGDAYDPNSALAQGLMHRPDYLNPAYITPQQLADLRARGQSYLKLPEAKSWTGAIAQTLGAIASNRMASQAALLDQAQARETADPSHWQGGAPAGASPVSGASPSGASASASPDAQSMVSAYAPQLGPAGAAGLVGGFGAESNYNPGIIGDSGASLGLGQWQGARRKNLEAYAQKHGVAPSDPSIQRQFPLVEMGLAGDSSDPGYGSERRSGEALRAAQTPQQATAAALMYERPGGYTPQNPQGANGYDRRLALATALMGKQGGASQGPAGGAMAYAGPQANPQGGMPAIGPGAGAPRSLAAPAAMGGQPQAAPGPVMAQAQPQPGSPPIVGLSAAQIGFIMANPNIPDHIKHQILGAQIPQPVGTPGGGTVFQAPGQPVRPNTVSPGIVTDPFGGSHTYAPASGGGAEKTLIPGGFTSTMGVGGQSLPAVTTMGQGGKPNTHLVAPGATSGDPLAGVKPLIREGQQIGSEGNELNADTEAMGAYKTQGKIADSKLGQMETFRALGQGIESGVSAQVKAKLGQYGFDLDSTAGRLQAYKFMAMMMLPPDASEGIREQIPTLSVDPQTRGQVADFIENKYKYDSQIGQIAGDNKTVPDASERRRKIQALKPPQQTFGGSPAAPSGSAPASGGAGDVIARAKAAIDKGAPRAAVIERLRKAGIDTTGL